MKKQQREKSKKIMAYVILVIFIASLIPMIFGR
ncbi:hypothetical protein BD780_001902 [Clostridium tetanomorphum]|uniref:DUF4044 domain-containing protein n=1 Tax=Clostridium tetanomorphum TaxID=1553 RepID=A0A923J1K4_CLOTT|nr:DUF4044 domain-containing protein [Clostridium tetanomorphum]MBC2398889.1 DUF4044 domain-containing protein [Clostridium tetanomorphum]MBP1865184.1 hypothetical protein [Clostridium tetanomorphum]NRS84677.1 hypothetical protein [Clostridium tetanomorphum]NRZ97892.1 hypothetical protein [Clostridium tetanomorphum]